MTEGDVPAGSAPQQWSVIFDARRLTEALRAAGPPLLFGLRMWASVCLALYIAFWLEVSEPFWAGASAAIVCQPHLGAALRKGWYRLIGTLVGAVMSVLLTACSHKIVCCSSPVWHCGGRLALSLPQCCATSRPIRRHLPGIRWRS